MVPVLRSITSALTRWIRDQCARLIAPLRHREPRPTPDKTLAERPPAIDSAPADKPAARPGRKKRARKPQAATVSRTLDDATPKCPHCRKPMVIKTARTGRNAGDFWGCADYPKCRGIRPIFKSNEPDRRG